MIRKYHNHKPQTTLWHREEEPLHLQVMSRCINTQNLKFLSQRILETDSMQFLETRSEVKFKVTETKLYYLTLCHPKMHVHTDFEIPTSNNIRDMLRTRLLKKTRSEVKVTMTCKWYVTLRHPQKHLHTKFGIPISKNIGDMHQTWCSF